MNEDIFGYFAAILTTAAFLPQLIKTLKTKKADDVSLTTLIFNYPDLKFIDINLKNIFFKKLKLVKIF